MSRFLDFSAFPKTFSSVFAVSNTFARRKLLALASAAACAVFPAAAAQVQSADDPTYPGIGRLASPEEIKAWDIDVRPDFTGLPAGSGSVLDGQEIYEVKCASCHGVFGESNEVFSPLIGGTTAEDIQTGHVANLKNTAYPGRTTMMKVATLSTLWDYINRAMPWNAPKTLTTNEVYAVLAYLLNLAEIVPVNFTLSNKNIAKVQARMPNRNGMTTKHNLWSGNEFGGGSQADTANMACMKDCTVSVKVSSLLPAHARNNHGNLALQNRLIGPQLGVDTTVPEGQGLHRPTLLANSVQQDANEAKADAFSDGNGSNSEAVMVLLQKSNCLACHGVSSKLVGPGLTAVAEKYSGQTDYLTQKIRSGGVGVWGSVPMPAQSLSEADARKIAEWLAAEMPK